MQNREMDAPQIAPKPALKPTPKTALLNFVELQALAASLNQKLAGARVDRIFVPALENHPQGYFKQEWCIEFYDQERSGQLFFSLRPQACGAFFLPPKTLKAASKATRSGFDLGLVKHLEGQRINKITAIQNERILELKFGSQNQHSTLLLYFIPAHPEAVLLSGDEKSFEVLNRTRDLDFFAYPAGRSLPPELQNKFSLNTLYSSGFKTYSDAFLISRSAAGLSIRQSRIEKMLRDRIDYWTKKSDSFTEHLSHQEDEKVWIRYGSLLQAQLYTKPTLINGHYHLTDYEKEETVTIPGDAKLNLKQQLEYYFHQAKRVKTRTHEASIRQKAAQEKLQSDTRLLQKLSTLASENPLPALLEIESELGLGKTQSTASKAVKQFSGKQFVSQEGLIILVGRNAIENLELTFKVARGSDVWMHVKGRPGAHAVVLIPAKRSASLETLLDAAHLCIYYSGGKEWGKTEVDYTYRKFVKKIKNQTEVTYSSNKTLMIAPEPLRLKRLLSE